MQMTNRKKPYELTPQEVAVILDALAEKPFKQVFPLIQRLMKEAAAEQEVPKVLEGEQA